jgi:hypothetical protein
MSVQKQDVAMALANALMRLGKNDHEGVIYHMARARANFEVWLHERAEGRNIEKLVTDAFDRELLKEQTRLTPERNEPALPRIVADCAYCKDHADDPMMPPHKASSACQSGNRPHCTCDACY